MLAIYEVFGASKADKSYRANRLIHEKSIIGARRQQQGFRRKRLRVEGPVRALILDGILSAKIKDLNPLVESRA